MAQQTELVKPVGSGKFWNALGAVTMALITLTMFLALLYAPNDDFQGLTQRIFYVHVATAWIAYLSFFVVFIGSVMFLVKRNEKWDHLAYASAELGVVFTTLVLITGSLWGRQIWGTWWVWDARLTSTLVLWLIYVGYLMLRNSSGDTPRTARFAAILGIVGFVDVPIIHMSVTWWRTLHPEPIVLRPGDGPQLPAIMLATMLLSVFSFTLLYFWLLQLRYRQEGLRANIRTIRQRLVEG